MIKVLDLDKNYGNFKAVSDLSFEAKSGEVIGFLGPNGAGKTTSLKMMAGILTPDNGDIEYSGESLRNERENVLRRIGYLPENNPLYKDWRVDEYLNFQLKVKDEQQDLKKLKEYLEKCGLEEVTTKIIGSLSKGYQQRVGLVTSLIGSPDYLLLDEPSTGLDPNQKERILNLIKDFAKDRTVIFSSHILSDVEKIADRLVIINKGKKVSEGSVKELIAKQKTGLKFNITAKVSKTEFNKVSKKHDFILDVTVTGKEGKYNKFLVSTVDKRNSAEELFKLILKNKWMLVEFVKQKDNLDDIFKSLTN